MPLSILVFEGIDVYITKYEIERKADAFLVFLLFDVSLIPASFLPEHWAFVSKILINNNKNLTIIISYLIHQFLH